jgi:type II secretory pathway component PulF
MRLPIPKRLARRLAPLGERINRFLREWEWTWTTAVVFSVAVAFFAIIMLAVVPSFWLYFADQTLRWKSFWLVKLKEALAAGWITTWFAIMFLLAYLLQEHRKKLRGTAGDTRITGGYR